MTKKDLLQKYFDMACHNLLCYSKNYSMSEPKDGCEKEWEEAGQEVELLKEMIQEEGTKTAWETLFKSQKNDNELIRNLTIEINELKKKIAGLYDQIQPESLLKIIGCSMVEELKKQGVK